MNKEYLQRLFDYDLWANTRLLRALQHCAPLQPDASMVRWFSHIIAAQQIWLRRVQGADLTGVTAWPDTSPAKWESLLQTTHADWKTQLEAMQDDLARTISYQNTRGDHFESSLHEIATHLIIHGQHHRAQIALHLRENGHTPPPTDFIFFTRSTTKG